MRRVAVASDNAQPKTGDLFFPFARIGFWEGGLLSGEGIEAGWIGCTTMCRGLGLVQALCADLMHPSCAFEA